MKGRRRKNKISTFDINTDEELTLFLKAQHVCGSIIYFETEKLKDIVILSPWWSIEAFKRLVSPH